MVHCFCPRITSSEKETLTGIPVSTDSLLSTDSALMEGAREAASTRLPLSDLPSSVVHHILKFSGNSDRLSVAATSKGMLNEVEAYSKSALARFKTKHGVDETFDARIRDQSNIVTFRSKPVELPSRYLLCAGKKVYLYKLGESQQEYGSTCRSLALSPSGNRILFAQNGRTEDMVSTDAPRTAVHVVDLPTKQRVCTIEHDIEHAAFLALNPEDDNVFWFDDLIVTCSERTIRVWTKTGQLKHEHHAGTLISGQKKRHSKGVMYISGRDKLQCLDVQTGVVITHSLSEMFGRLVTERENFEIVAICEGKWLILKVWNDQRRVSLYSKIYSIDLRDYSIKHWIDGRFVQLVQAADCSTMIYAVKLNIVDVVKIVDGNFLQRCSFPAPVSTVLTACESNLVARLGGGHKLGVFNAENGELKGSLNLPQSWRFLHAKISKSRQELFVGLTRRVFSFEGFAGDPETVAAYCLNESDDE